MANNDVEISIGADTSDAEKSLENFKKSSTENLTAIEKAFGGLKAAAVTAVAAFSAKQVFDFFAGGVTSAIEAEAAFTKMSKALELSGNAVPGAAEAFNQLSDNIERVTGLSAEVVQEQIAVAQSFELTNAETQKLIVASTELSAATGEDLATSVKNLGETFTGTLGRLKKTVPELATLSKESLAAGGAIDSVLSRFRGSAAKNLDTFRGLIEQVGIAFGKIPEAFGEVVVKNETLRQALKVLTDTFYGLTEIITNNQSTIGKFITLAVDPLMGALSAAVRVVGFFNNAINGVQLAVFGLGKVFLDVTAFAEEFDAKISKFTFGGRQYEQAANQAKEARQRAEEYTQALQLMNDQVVSEKKSFDQLNDSILNYKTVTNESTKSIDLLAIAEANGRKERAKSAAELEKLERAYESLNRKVASESLDALEKQLAAYEENMDELERLQQEGLTDLKKINQLRLEIVRSHEANVSKIQKQAAEERKSEIEKILKETSFTGLVKLALSGTAAADLQKEIRTKIGTVAADVGATAISAVTQGEKGFTQLVTNLVKAIPVFGNLIAAAVELGTLTPEENEKAIKGFAEGITASMDNFNTNLGRLPDILSEVAGPLIEKLLGPLFANFISNLMKSLSAWPKLVPVIAQGVAQGLGAMGGIMAEAFKKALTDTGSEATRFYDNVRQFFGTFANQVKGVLAFVFGSNPLLTELKSMRQGQIFGNNVLNFLVSAFKSVPGILIQIRDLFNSIGEKFIGAFDNLGAKISDGFQQIVTAFKNFFEAMISAIKDLPNQIKNVFGSFQDGMKNALREVFSSFFETFNNLSERLKGFISGGGGISSVANGGGTSLESLIPGRARGLTEVPPGYSNDNYLTRLSSGERVVDANTNGDLKQFLENANQGGLGNAEMIGLLRQIAASLGTPRPVTIQVDKKVLGRTMLDMSRRNERTTA